jgi:hypothetical protein
VNSDGGDSASSGDVEVTLKNHGIMMAVIWLGGSLILISTMRWFKNTTSFNQTIHNIVGWSATATTLYASISLILGYGKIKTGIHTILGLILTILTVILAILGVTSYLAKLAGKRNKLLIYAGKIHGYIGILTVILGAPTSATGIGAYYSKRNPDLRFLAPLAGVSVIVLILAMEIRLYRLNKSKTSVLEIKQSLPIISEI